MRKTMKVLMICNTYFQIFVAIRMKNTIFVNDIVDVVISDRCGYNKEIPSRVKALGIFNNVFFKKTKYIVQKKNSAAKRINEVMNMTFGLKIFKDICNIRYDKMLFYNIDEVTYILYSMMSKNNPDLICERFEEGILSYNNSFPSSDKMKIARLLRKLLHKRNLLEQILHFYCFTPAVYEGKLGTLIIPPIESINDSSVTQFLSLFAVNNVSSCYKQKYIYFSSVYDFEGGEPIGELDLVKKIAEKVKNENLIVKVHPRDNPQRFIECGLNVDLNSQIPWEVVQFKQDFSQHIFLTVNSGSVLGVNMIISDMPRTYFLFPLCDLDKNPKAQVSAKNIDKLMKFINQIPEKRDRIKIASDLSEIL